MKKTGSSEKALHRLKWRRPEVEALPLQFSIADSVLKEFVLSHDPSAVLIELVQNEYDAEGTRLEMSLGEDSVTITGNGKPVDHAGWSRLSVMMGTGAIAGSDRMIKAKANSIGSKNFGLRSLFIYGDQIWVRSGGRQTVLDLHRGALPKPLPERNSRHRPGIHIEVPYRITTKSDMEAFSIDKEDHVLRSFSRDVTSVLIKLANPESSKSLQELVVSSKRCQRRIAWKQVVAKLSSSSHNARVLHRTITMKDYRNNGRFAKHVQKLEEIEFQKSFLVPQEYRHLNIPSYFRIAGGRIRLTLSMRVKRGKVDLSEPGLFYYPLGLIHAHTGTAISVNAPFQLDNDRTRILDPENNPWNGWLLEKAADFTFELLIADWLERFGHQAYLALNELTHPSVTQYRDSLARRLETEPCWPTRERTRGRIQFAKANDIVIPAAEDLDDFLSENRYLDSRLASVPEVGSMVRRHGAKTFTVNSLVRLRCFGEDASTISTKLGDEEANCYYTEFPDAVKDEERQVRFATALDSRSRNLSKENRFDLSTSSATLAADNNLRSPSYPLWVIDSAIVEVCPVPNTNRLHPLLVTSKTITALCRKFDALDWTRKTSQRIQDGEASEEEQEALYRYVVSVHGHLGRKTITLLRKLPILRDHRGEWVAPYKITAKRSAMTRRLEPVMHFPGRGYGGDLDLARAFRFKQGIEGSDVLEYAQLVERRTELAEEFEETLHRLSRLLARPLVKKLSQMRILRSSKGEVLPPAKLYIGNRLNHVCLGDRAPYVEGSRASLYRLLGCRDVPKAEDIVTYLRELVENNEKPEQPEVVYTALATALHTEKLPSDYYSKEPIIWNGIDYSSPENTLLGSRYRKTFLDAVPCISVTSAKLREVFSSLGVCSQPQERHWRQLLIWFGQTYQGASSPVPENERRALRNAYRQLSGIPDGLPDRTKCFLDRNGVLHDVSDISRGVFLIDDNPRMAQIAIKERIPISFADTSESGTLAFFVNAGVKSITTTQRLEEVRIGDITEPPAWFNPVRILKQIHSPEFASALAALTEYVLTGSIGKAFIDTSKLARQLGATDRIYFTKRIEGIYTIGNYTVTMPEEFALQEESIALLRIRGYSELNGLLAQAIATIPVSEVSIQRTLSDAIYRLLTCRSVREIKRYLHNKGVPWEPTSTEVEDWEEVEEDEGEYRLGEEEIGSMIADLFKQSITRDKTPDQGYGITKPPSKPEAGVEVPTPASKPRSLPPLQDLKVRQLESSDSWSPPVPLASGKGGPYSWTPPSPADNQWGQTVGKRGEEIIYKQVLDRITAMGYPQSKVVWVAEADPDADFDILSVDDDGQEIWIEVKSTTGRDGRFRWPKAEFEKAIEKRDRYILWRVYEADTTTPSVKPFRDPVGMLLRQGMRLDIDTFYAMVEPMQA